MALTKELTTLLQQGTVIPAHPLVLTPDLQLDEYRQRRLTRYYLESGAGGVAVGVHTTQFEIRRPEYGLYERVLDLAAQEVASAQLQRPFIKVAGICGATAQAVGEAKTAVKHGYHLGLLSLGGLNDWDEDRLVAHVREVAAVIPVFGFYLQPAVGGRILSYRFWEQFAAIENVKAIKVAAFNRYQTLDVVRAVCTSDRYDEIALYTGNDDNIVADLLTRYAFEVGGERREKRFVGGLLGHWAVWTRAAVSLFAEIKACRDAGYVGCDKLLQRGVEVTDMNAAIFDVANQFHGCIAGIHEVLRRQGLMEGIWCLNPAESLSPGQAEEIDRVVKAYPHLIDDDFVKTLLGKE
ncbi:dihydrodipicolinate synthase family protein [Parapedobacter defluvii]|uniref:dihydrodipicolinate synthase family protein n=1 Tax=Parapedobacter defluvii TaxID=2045106 RepID=UPI000FA73869|nr:MAG: dihydrodipicolinate synthase family protein [Parapedobacter sp.]